MVVEYNTKYDEDIKDLLVELQEYIQEIDVEGYNIVTEEYREECFKDNLKEINENDGKMLLYKENNKIVGFVIGIKNKEENSYDFKCPMRGTITELIVSKKVRNRGIGSILLKAMEDYLKSSDCKSILLGVFGYNYKAIKFYEKNGYHTRMIDMIKVD